MNATPRPFNRTGAAALATAATLLDFSGWLSPDQHRDHAFIVGRGWYAVDLTNHRLGDLDAKVFGENGELLVRNLRLNNHPSVAFHSDRYQTVRVRVINADSDRSAEYDGAIEVCAR